VASPTKGGTAAMLGFKLLTYDAVRNELGRHILGTDSVALALITSFLAGLICYALMVWDPDGCAQKKPRPR